MYLYPLRLETFTCQGTTNSRFWRVGLSYSCLSVSNTEDLSTSENCLLFLEDSFFRIWGLDLDDSLLSDSHFARFFDVHYVFSWWWLNENLSYRLRINSLHGPLRCPGTSEFVNSGYPGVTVLPCFESKTKSHFDGTWVESTSDPSLSSSGGHL